MPLMSGEAAKGESRGATFMVNLRLKAGLPSRADGPATRERGRFRARTSAAMSDSLLTTIARLADRLEALKERL